MTAPANRVTYKEIIWSLIKIAPPIVIVALLYKPIRSHIVHDLYVTALVDAGVLSLLFLIVRWGAGDVLRRLRKEEEHSKNEGR
jgi:hypothetical protein